MSYPVLKRNRYYDEENGYEYESSERNYFQDFVDFHLPFARTQQVYRTRGIAHGLEVQGKSGDAAIFVQPGVAVDGQGRLIVLPSAGGSACAWDPANGDCIVIPIGDGGLALPIAASWPTGALLYLVIEFYELLRRDEGCGGRLEQAPKLYALPVVELDARPDLAETAIILGIITLNATHKLATLSDHDAGCTRCRRILGERLGSIELQRVAVTEGGALVAEAAGTIEPDGPTGLRIETPELHLSGDLDMDGAARVKGDLELAGLVKSPTGTVIVSSPAALRSTLTVDGNASIGKSGAPANLTVNGKADVKDTLHVVKPVTLDQSLSVGGRLDVGSSGSAANLTVNGKVDVKDTLHVVKPVTLDQGLSVGGSVSLGSPNAAITMTGTLTFKGVATFQGNIGAGTAGPKARLSVVATGAAEINGTAHSSTLRISAGTLGAPGGSELSLASIGLQANNNMSLGVRAVRSVTGSDWTSVAIGLGLDVDNTVRAGASLWLHANGSVGVGTANPGAKLEVAGHVAAAAGGRFVELWCDNAIIAHNSAALRLGHASDLVAHNWAEKMRIAPDGKVGIGTTEPKEKLHVSGSYLRVDGAGNEQAYIGGDGIGGDVQVGSLNPNVTGVSLYNPGVKARMNLAANDIDMTGRLFHGGLEALHIVGIQQLFTDDDSSEPWRYGDLCGHQTGSYVDAGARAWNPFLHAWGNSVIRIYLG